MLTRATVVLVVAGVALGGVAGYLAHGFVGLARSGGISEARMKELTGGPCAGVLRGASDEVIAVLRRVYDLPQTRGPDLEVKSVGDCTFAFVLESDHSGIARVDFGSPPSSVRRVRFFEWGDDSLWSAPGPTFSAHFFSADRRLYVFDDRRERLFETAPGDLSAVHELGEGMTRDDGSGRRRP